MSLHIGFDISQTGRSKAGCGYYADAMVRALTRLAPEHRYDLYPNFGNFYFDPQVSLARRYKAPHLRLFPRRFVQGAADTFWAQRDLEDALEKPDIVHANNFWCPVQLRSSRLIYTLYDLGFAIEPSWTTEENRIGCFNGVFRAAIAADWVVAISKASAKDFRSHFPHYPADRIQVIYPCTKFSDLDRTGVRPGGMKGIGTGRFWLSVGTLEPRKNHLGLVQSYARYLAIGGLPYPLVFSGPRGWKMEGFEQELERLGIADKVVRLGYVSDDELIWLYRHCFANIYPSFFEGFGLPVLEGMQFGAATLTSNVSSIPEIAEGVAILLDPHNVEAWAQSMLSLVSDPGQHELLQEKARARASHFRWERSAGELLELYKVAAETPKRGVVD